MMSVSVKWLDERTGDTVLIIGDEDLREFRSAFDKLYRLTGVTLDLYSDTRLSPDHGKIWLSEIDNNITLSRKANELLNLLKLSTEEGRWLLFLGD